MNRRVLLLTGFLFVVWLTTLWGLWGQQNQLAGLRSDQQQLLAQVAANSSESPDTAEAGGAGSRTPPTTSTVTPELLRLRSEVTRLTERRRELAGARAENERLRAQFSSRGTNGAAGFVTPPGYIRKSEARMVGYNTPDDTLQSLLWAVQNHDLTNLLQAFTPEMAAEINAGITKSDKSIGDFFRDGAGFVGMSVVGRTEDHTSAGSIYVEVEVFPGVPHQQIRFRQTDGQWKIAGPF